jgi:imidazole glycerol-phosphate synthase subunit HisH
MIKQKKIVVVDYGMGNLWSVVSALDFLGADPIISSNPAEITKADAILLPGVGSFRLAMQALVNKNLYEAIKEAVQIKQRKILGICLGFQMLAESSTEDGMTAGLGFIPTPVESFSVQELERRKLPHIGFNRARLPNSSSLFEGFKTEEDFYFVHSYRLLAQDLPGKKAICNYGTDFLAAYEHENVFGAQFHPEKSQTNGLRVLANFLSA